MSRKKKVDVEIVPASDAALIPPSPKEPSTDLKAYLEGIVRKQMGEILAESSAGELGDDCRPRRVAKAAREVQDAWERVKWPTYFEEWGCRVCERKTVAHTSTGHCERCQSRLRARLTSLRRRFEQAHPEAEIERRIDQLTLASRTAEELLGGHKK